VCQHCRRIREICFHFRGNAALTADVSLFIGDVLVAAVVFQTNPLVLNKPCRQNPLHHAANGRIRVSAFLTYASCGLAKRMAVAGSGFHLRLSAFPNDISKPMLLESPNLTYITNVPR